MTLRTGAEVVVRPMDGVLGGRCVGYFDRRDVYLCPVPTFPALALQACCTCRDGREDGCASTARLVSVSSARNCLNGLSDN